MFVRSDAGSNPTFSIKSSWIRLIFLFEFAPTIFTFTLSNVQRDHFIYSAIFLILFRVHRNHFSILKLELLLVKTKLKETIERKEKEEKKLQYSVSFVQSVRFYQQKSSQRRLNIIKQTCGSFIVDTETPSGARKRVKMFLCSVEDLKIAIQWHWKKCLTNIQVTN